MYKRMSAVVVVSMALATMTLAQKINTDWDRGANFANFHTYMWEKSPHPAKGLWDQRIVDAVNRQLQAKGLTQVDSNPDLWVVYSNSMKDVKQVVGSGYVVGPAWGWGPTRVGYATYITREGTLVIELADARNKQLLWRGSATDTISDKSNKNIKILDKAVAKLFKNYPPKEKK